MKKEKISGLGHEAFQAEIGMWIKRNNGEWSKTCTEREINHLLM
jgi:hypothetical protein